MTVSALTITKARRHSGHLLDSQAQSQPSVALNPGRFTQRCNTFS
jgi:hypothetical protein